MEDDPRNGDHGSRRPPGVPKRLLTVEQAAGALSVSRSKLYELIARREIDTVHIGRSVRITADALDDFVAKLRPDSAA